MDGDALVQAAGLETAVQSIRNDHQHPVTYVDTLLERIKEVNPDIKALLPEANRDRRLRREATALTERFSGWKLPSMYGIPVGVKDIFHVDGFPTQGGSDLPAEALAGPEASVVSNLKRAGALVLGKTVTTEFAYFEPGPTRNPHDLARTPGGSSSGSAAAVAAGICPLALGTQTVGSTIRPASFCGITGFKPSYGRIPMDGVLPLAESVDHIGLFTQDISGMNRAASVVCQEWSPPDTRTPCLGVPDGPYLDQASPEALDEFERHLSTLDTAGFEIHRIESLDDIEEVNQRHDHLVAAEAALVHHEWYEKYSDRYREGTVKLIEEGRKMDTEGIARCRSSRGELRRQLSDLMNVTGIDIWLSPATPGPAPEGIDSTGNPVMNVPWTHAGLPTVSLPIGQLAGLPFGLQCSARYGYDEALLGWCEGIMNAK